MQKRSFDDMPLMVRREIFGYVWPELTLSKVRTIYEQEGAEVVMVDLHLYGYANEMIRIGSMYIGEQAVICGVSPKLMSIYTRLGIKTQDEFRDYYMKKQGVHTIVLWGLLTDNERTGFLNFVKPFLNGTDNFVLLPGWN